MNIRRYQPSDWQGIIDITTEAFALVSIYSAVERAFGLLNGVSWQERKVAEVVAEIENNSGGVWVAEIAGEPVGFITTPRWLNGEPAPATLLIWRSPVTIEGKG